MPINIEENVAAIISTEVNGSSTRKATATIPIEPISAAQSGTRNSPSMITFGIGAFSFRTAVPDSASSSSLDSATSMLSGRTTSSTVERSEPITSTDDWPERLAWILAIAGFSRLLIFPSSSSR